MSLQNLIIRTVKPFPLMLKNCITSKELTLNDVTSMIFSPMLMHQVISDKRKLRNRRKWWKVKDRVYYWNIGKYLKITLHTYFWGFLGLSLLRIPESVTTTEGSLDADAVLVFKDPRDWVGVMIGDGGRNGTTSGKGGVVSLTSSVSSSSSSLSVVLSSEDSRSKPCYLNHVGEKVHTFD